MDVDDVPELDRASWVLELNCLFDCLLDQDLAESIDLKLRLVLLQQIHHHRPVRVVLALDEALEGLQGLIREMNRAATDDLTERHADEVKVVSLVIVDVQDRAALVFFEANDPDDVMGLQMLQSQTEVFQQDSQDKLAQLVVEELFLCFVFVFVIHESISRKELLQHSISLLFEIVVALQREQHDLAGEEVLAFVLILSSD